MFQSSELSTLIEGLKIADVNHSKIEQALTHKSFSRETSNEKLEFIGDAVLDLAMANLLASRFPEWGEGQLSRIRASLVNESALSQKAQELGLSSLIRLGKSEIVTGGSDKPRLLASALEALIGVTFLEIDYGRAEKVVEFIFRTELAGNIESDNFDYKSQFQELAQEKIKETPVYRLLSESGPSHAREFTIQVWVNEKCYGEAKGASKKNAEQMAAQIAISKLKEGSEV